MNISAFFPAYNEEKNIKKITESFIGVLGKITDNYEVIIVNDGSKDKTSEVSKKLCDEYSAVKLVEHTENKGYGEAIKSGLRACHYEWIFFTDGDNQFDVKEIKKFLPYINDYQVIIGFRKKRQDNFMRRFNAWAWGKLISLLLPNLKGIKDIDCAFKLIKKEVIDKITLETGGAMISAELLLKICKKGYKVKQIGVNHYPRRFGKQSGADFKVVFRAFKELFKFYKEFR